MKLGSRPSTGSFAIVLRRIRTLAADECGLIASLETLLLTVVMAMGLIAGLASLNSGVVQEIADTAVALDHIDQTYTFTVTTDPMNAPPAGLTLDDAPVAE